MTVMKYLPLLIFFISYNSMKKEGKLVSKIETKTQSKSLPLNSQWILERFDNADFKDVTKTSYINITEDLKSFSGNCGCNIIDGGLIVKDHSIIFNKVFATRMYCEKTMKQEDLFLKNLNETNTFEIVGGELFLYKDKLLLMTLESFR